VTSTSDAVLRQGSDEWERGLASIFGNNRRGGAEALSLFVMGSFVAKN
jgi:hypothetical protein